MFILLWDKEHQYQTFALRIYEYYVLRNSLYVNVWNSMWIDLLVFTNGEQIYEIYEIRVSELEDEGDDNIKATVKEKHITTD